MPKFTKIKHDPFAVPSSMTKVNYDPFAQPQAKPSMAEIVTQGLLMGAEGDTSHARAAAEDIYRAAKEPVEYGALMAGGVGGAALGGPAGGAAGAGLAYAGAKRATKGIGTALGLERPETLTEIATSTVGDIGEGALGEVLGMLPAKVATKLTPLARRLYASSLKPAPSMPTSQREKIITIGLDNAVQGKPYRPTEKQVYQLGRKITELVESADYMVELGAKSGDKVPTKPLLSSIDNVIAEFKQLPFPQKDVDKLRIYKAELMANKGAEMSADQALAMKKKIYQIADKYYRTGQTAVIPAKAEAEKAIAHAIKTELESLYPVTAPINKEASRQIEFGKVLERAANRSGNRELFSFFDFLGGTMGATIGTPANAVKGAVIGGAWSHITSNPQMKAKIAKEIMRAQIPGAMKKELVSQIMKYGTVKIADKQTTGGEGE